MPWTAIIPRSAITRSIRRYYIKKAAEFKRFTAFKTNNFSVCRGVVQYILHIILDIRVPLCIFIFRIPSISEWKKSQSFLLLYLALNSNSRIC